VTRIQLPLRGRTRLFGPGLIACFTLLGLTCQIAWPWRAGFAVSILLSGAWMWRRYLKQRPVSLVLRSGGAISCSCGDGRVLEVSRVRPGIMHPVLVCARLEADSGGCCDLFVPSDALSSVDHRQLRRALIGFRPAQSDPRRGT
jgi:hypothetical protein